MDNTVLIDAHDLHRHFGEHPAVRGLDLELRRGEVLGLLGPNGAGKSTVLRMLTGNLEPGTGSIHINGIDLGCHPGQAKARLGYLPEQPPLYLDLTVDEYLGYCGQLHGLKPPGQAVNEARARCGLADMGRRLIGNLSKGYQQRVGIAQAILHRPDIIILDEPTDGLDPRQRQEVRGLIRELGREHGVILSSHILSEVQASCDRVMIMNRGRCVYSAPLADSNAAHDVSGIRLGLRLPPAAEALLAIAGVRGVEPVDDRHLTIQLHEAADAEAIAAQLAEAADREGWGLFELSPQRRSLEQVFLALTQSQDAGAGDAA